MSVILSVPLSVTDGYKRLGSAGVMSGLASVFQFEKFHGMEFEGVRGSSPWLLHFHLSEPEV